MQYRFIKSINNNVVLVSELDTPENLILMAKGIGFNRKSGDIISDDLNGREVIKFLSGEKTIQTKFYDKNEVKAVVENVVKLAEDKLSIKSKNFYPDLLDHICFAIDRLQFGIPIENPFVNEISVLYADEYKIAQKAIKMIQEKLHVNMGNAEAGFIALHLHSARSNKPVSASLKNVQILNKVMELIYNEASVKNSHEKSKAEQAFLLSITNIIDMAEAKQSFHMPEVCNIAKGMSQSRAIAMQVKQVIEEETGSRLSGGDIDFITVNVEQLRQQIYKLK